MTNRTIYYLGDYLSFHHLAAIAFFGEDHIFHPEPSFDAIIEKVKMDELAFAVIAAENTVAGDIPGNYQRICSSGLSVVGTVTIPVQLHLAAKTDLELNAIHAVYTHAMAILETNNFFSRVPHIQLMQTHSTSTAIKMVAESSETGIAAIGNKAAIQFYGLQIIAENIDNHAENFTRFLILSNKSTDTQTTNLPVIASICMRPLNNLSSQFEHFIGAMRLCREIADGRYYIETAEMLPEQLFNLLSKIDSDLGTIKVLGIYPLLPE